MNHSRFLFAEVLCLYLLILPSFAWAELDEISLNTLEFANEFERGRGLKLTKQLKTSRVSWSRLSKNFDENRFAFDQRASLEADRDLYLALGFKLGDIQWPWFGSAYSPRPDNRGAQIFLCSNCSSKVFKTGHFFSVGQAIFDQHFDLISLLSHGNGDRKIATESLVLGDILYSHLSGKSAFHSAEIEQRIKLAQDEIRSQFVKTPAKKNRSSISSRLMEARIMEGVAGAISLRDNSPLKVIDEYYKRGMPRSTSQLLHTKFMREDRQNRSVDVTKIDALPGEYKSGVLGELRLRLWLESLMDQDVAKRASAGWAGDGYALYKTQDPEQAPPLVLLVAFDDFDQDKEAEAREFTGSVTIGLSKQFSTQPLPDQLGEGIAQWMDESQKVTLVERRREIVLLLLGCPGDKVASVRDHVWKTWKVGRADLGVIGGIMPTPPEDPSPEMVIPPWYRRTPGIVALMLWLVVALPGLGYLMKRWRSTSPIKTYIWGALFTIILIAAGWYFEL